MNHVQRRIIAAVKWWWCTDSVIDMLLLLIWLAVFSVIIFHFPFSPPTM